MNKNMVRAFAGLLLGASFSANAAIIMDPSTLDGGFESGSVAAGQWDNSANATRIMTTYDTSSVYAGTYASGIGVDGAGLVNILYQNTGYTVTTDDTFTLDFWACSRYAMQASDAVVATLYTTDDNLETGTRTVVGTFTADNLLYRDYGSTSYGGSVAVSSLSASDQSAVVGQDLFVEFTTVMGGTARYARVDDVTLSVIPEPATLGLVGVFGFGMLIIRRRLIM